MLQALSGLIFVSVIVSLVPGRQWDQMDHMVESLVAGSHSNAELPVQ